MLQALADTVRAKLRNHRRPESEAFIRHYEFPTGLRGKLAARLPGIQERKLEDVLSGLKDFFLLYLEVEGFRLGMPSKAVDAAWHEFILYTRDYTAFCEHAFGRYLHHVPDDPRSEIYDPLGDLGRTWILHCIRNDEDPHAPTSVPLFFSIDAELGLPDPRAYTIEDLAGLPIPPGFIETEPGRYRYIGGRPKRPAYWVGSFGVEWFGSGGSRAGGHHGGDTGGGHGGGHGCGGHGCSGGGCGNH
jgi:hypothetical protein